MNKQTNNQKVIKQANKKIPNITVFSFKKYLPDLYSAGIVDDKIIYQLGVLLKNAVYFACFETVGLFVHFSDTEKSLLSTVFLLIDHLSVLFTCILF